MTQNQRIILRDVCIPSAAWDVRRKPVFGPPGLHVRYERCRRPVATNEADRMVLVVDT